MSNKLGIAGVVVGIIGLVPWVLDMAGIDTSGALAPYVPVMLDVWRVISPFAILFGGGAIGWIIRDRSKTRDAETAARIRREDEEHAEKMRREREEYEEKRRVAKEEAEREAMARARGVNMVSDFRHATPSVKQHVIQMFNEGAIRMREDSFNLLNLWKWADYTTVEESWPDYDTIVMASLKPETRKMIEENRELISEVASFS